MWLRQKKPTLSKFCSFKYPISPGTQIGASCLLNTSPRHSRENIPVTLSCSYFYFCITNNLSYSTKWVGWQWRQWAGTEIQNQHLGEACQMKFCRETDRSNPITNRYLLDLCTGSGSDRSSNIYIYLEHIRLSKSKGKRIIINYWVQPPYKKKNEIWYGLRTPLEFCRQNFHQNFPHERLALQDK